MEASGRHSLVKYRRANLGREKKFEALAVRKPCLKCGRKVCLVWRVWHGWTVKPAVCGDCCGKLFAAVEGNARDTLGAT
jgi:hypothetical protein